MVAAQVNGNHTTITTAAPARQLPAKRYMLPVYCCYNLLQSINILSNSCEALAPALLPTSGGYRRATATSLSEENPILGNGS